MRLLILLGLLFGVLYSLHLLAKDYQALTAASKILKFLFKRDVSSQNYTLKPNVRWRKILLYDATQCARFFYCSLGADTMDAELRGFTFMLTLEPREEDKSALEIMKRAHEIGSASGEPACKYHYPICPVSKHMLFELVKYLVRHEK
ncbi:uncharacterized protein LOC128676747 isoform X2 [Plodia interpunctella]|uniref:uncharacterized protein LOC128676747 isoform X2 n=1 Tax=Plodia interpunctella TaxID=58824 RepID=UPI0023676295|nr:uncharacterized protein LOC128676747 isoform X2 [Plodia interpunctella]